ncbi:MAG: DUF6690 family protein [Planctomycetota bacterium]
MQSITSGVSMIHKTILAVAGLGAAVVGPWACFTAADLWEGTRRDNPVSEAHVTEGTPAVPDAANAWQVPSVPPPATLPGALPVVALQEAFRFDISPQYVLYRWPKVSAAVPELQLQGYRVPLVTGTQPGDLAGSLTYYFNPYQQVQRIVFRGTTGDVGPLTQMLVARFRLARRLTNHPGLLQFEGMNSKNQPASLVRIRSAPVVRAEDQLHRFSVELVLERPEA